MSQARVFVPQEALDDWLTGGRATLTGDTLVLDGQSFQVLSALRFVAEVAGGGDKRELVGRVKSVAQLAWLGGGDAVEHHGTSLLLGDDAYEVVEGYALRALALTSDDPYGHVVRLFTRP